MSGAAEIMKARLRALTARERILLVSCGAVLLGLLLARAVVFPAIGEYRRNRAAIPAMQAELARQRLAAEGADSVEEALSEAAERLEELEEGLLPGIDPSGAGVTLQGILKPMVDRPDTRVTSVRGLAPASKGAYTEVAVQVDMQTTTEGLASILAAVPRSPKYLRVRKLSVNMGYYGASMAGMRETLMASVVVTGLVQSGGEAAPLNGREGGAE